MTAKSLASAKTLAWQLGAESRARQFVKLCAEQRLPEPEREYRFHETRRWRADFAWPDRWVLLESDGGRWSKAQSRKHGFNDIEKRNEAQIAGWTVLVVGSDQLVSLDTISLVKRALGDR